ncbi:MAG: NADH-quinone oxidoreductase subunit L, partial [Fimbriimonadaceae bacterium]|nr:NADH-quinone oxidoreductase subunit L [Fimbriimonadaceae bacterium]
GNNLALLFIGWEGVGVCSYLLIGFWYKDLANSRAANKAFIVNRIGDVGLTLGMFWIAFLVAGNKELLGITDARFLSYDVILPAAKTIFEQFPTETTWICILLFIGAMGKSAQFPLYIWLPDAMAGPTPVSALIHAATMVTSGVVLLNRMSDFFLLSKVAMTVVAVVGALTALLGALMAFGQTDIKKVLAYSTVSQLGYMFIACGVGAFWAGMFHVMTHAAFKALLFLGSGAVIHAMAHNQDMRNYGMLQKNLKLTFAFMGVGYLAIAGVPFLFSGFWSKEAVLGKALNDTAKTLELGIAGIPTWGSLAGWVGFLVAAMTAFYMTRMMVLTFGSGDKRWLAIEPAHGHHDDHGHDHHHHAHDHGPDPHGFFYTAAEQAEIEAKEEHEHHHELDKNHKPHEVSPVMWVPLAVLALGSIGWFGAMGYGDIFAKGHHAYPLETWLFPAKAMADHGGEAAKETTKLFGVEFLIGLSVVTWLLGTLAALAIYAKGLPKSEGFDMKAWNPFMKASLATFGIDRLLTQGIGLRLGEAFGRVFRWIDENIVDGLVKGMGYLAQFVGGLTIQPQSGRVRHYALLMQIGVVAVVGWLTYILFFATGGGR